MNLWLVWTQNDQWVVITLGGGSNEEIDQQRKEALLNVDLSTPGKVELQIKRIFPSGLGVIKV